MIEKFTLRDRKKTAEVFVAPTMIFPWDDRYAFQEGERKKTSTMIFPWDDRYVFQEGEQFSYHIENGRILTIYYLVLITSSTTLAMDKVPITQRTYENRCYRLEFPYD